MSSDDTTSIDKPGSPGGDAIHSRRLSTEVVLSLYETHAKELLAFLTGVLRNIEDAREVSQITLLRLMESGHSAHEATRKGWMFQVALREALQLKRKAETQARQLNIYLTERQYDQLVTSTEITLMNGEEIGRLKQILTQLPADQRHVIRERMYESKSFATIASELNVPIGTVLTRMRLALEKLRKWLAND